MKTEYYIINNKFCSYPLRKFIGICTYIWRDNKWDNIGTLSLWPDRDKKTITEEKAFRYILEN